MPLPAAYKIKIVVLVLGYSIIFMILSLGVCGTIT